jgi:dienelactone hydrolase
MQRAVPDAFRRHGKLLFLEDDMRFHHVREWVPSHQYCTKTPEESAAVMRRDWLVKFLDGTGIQLCDPFNGVGKRTNTFDHPSILGAMEESINAVAQAGPLPVESGNDILVISDVSQRFKWTAAISARKILRNVSALLPHNLQTTGAAVDMATLADYLACDYPHRLVYVMDACNLAAADRALLEKKTSRPGVQAYRFALPDVADVSPSNAPALPLPDSADAWRKMFKEHGAHLYGESGSWLRRRGNLIAYATGRAGRHRLTLKPGEKGATELFSGRHFTGETIEFDTDIPQTWLFKVEPGIRPDANPDLTNHFLDMEKPVYYFAAKPLSEGDPCTVAMLVVHGWGGRPTWAAPEALRFREAARKMLGADAVQPFVITPSFPRRVVMKSCGVEEDGRAVWNDSWEVPLTQRGSQHDDWRGGGDARGTKLSSFDVIDRIFAELSDRKRYPNLKRVVLAGFSAGGQFVGRYAAVGKGRVRDGVEVAYMALSPSTELRLDDDVAWHYGLKDRPRYSRDLTRAQIYANLSSRRVWRACGVNDVLGRPHTSLDNCPEANLQGNNRLHRFRNFKEYLKGYPEWQKMVSFYEIPEIGHKCQLAFVDPSFVRFALGL